MSLGVDVWGAERSQWMTNLFSSFISIFWSALMSAQYLNPLNGWIASLPLDLLIPALIFIRLFISASEPVWWKLRWLFSSYLCCINLRVNWKSHNTRPIKLSGGFESMVWARCCYIKASAALSRAVSSGWAEISFAWAGFALYWYSHQPHRLSNMQNDKHERLNTKIDFLL